jgi:hypothetical protein
MKDEATFTELCETLDLTRIEMTALKSINLFRPVRTFGNCQIFNISEVAERLKAAATPDTRLWKRAVKYLRQQEAA